MSTPVAEQDSIQYNHGGYITPAERQASKHRMQRAARLFAGKATLRDKIAAQPDKGWLALIILGVGFVAYALGAATLLALGI